MLSLSVSVILSGTRAVYLDVSTATYKAKGTPAALRSKARTIPSLLTGTLGRGEAQESATCCFTKLVLQ